MAIFALLAGHCSQDLELEELEAQDSPTAKAARCLLRREVAEGATQSWCTDLLERLMFSVLKHTMHHGYI